SLIPVLFIVSLVIFLLVHITPGDPAAIILGVDASEEQKMELRESLGLDRPLHEQYFTWIGSAVTGDFGDSYFLRQPVTTAIFNHLRPTLSLAIFAQIITIVIAIPLGISAARRRGSLADQSIMGVSLLGMSVPSFLLGLLLILLFGVKLG